MINLREKAQYGEATRVRVPVTGKINISASVGLETDTRQHVTSLDHFCWVKISIYNSKKKNITDGFFFVVVVKPVK